MKKTLIVAAVSALAAGSALAQSSVTLYGRLNTTVEREDANGVKISKVNNVASRWGIKGTEDMGGGLKAGFQLESGFASDTGAVSGAFFGRQAEVNLSGGFGAVRLGQFTSEAYFATADYVSMHNHDTGNSEDKLYAYVGRNSNKIAYRAPAFVKGLSLEGSISLGESANRGPAAAPASAKETRAYDFALNYDAGIVHLGFGAERNQQSEQYAARALVELGALTLGGYVQRDKNGFGSPSAPSNARLGNRTNIRVSAMYTIGASELHVNFGSAGKYSNVADSKAKQFTFAYNYNLSKRTKVYAYYTKVDNNSFAYGPVTKGDFSSIAAGIRHNF